VAFELELFVKQERLKDCICRETVNRQELISDSGTDNHQHDQGRNWRRNINTIDGRKQNESEAASERRDENRTEEHVNAPDTTSDCEPANILNHEYESIECTRAETLISQCNLDISILRDVLDTLFKNEKTVASQTKENLDTRHCFINCAHLLSVVLKDVPDRFT